MTREMQRRIRENKQEAVELIRYAAPQNGRTLKNCPSVGSVTKILEKHVLYNGEKPVITNIEIIDYSKNDIIKSAHFRVKTAEGRTFKITAYQELKGRTQEQKEYDKTAMFPSGLFNVFHDEIV